MQIKCALVAKSTLLVYKQNYDKNYNFLYGFMRKLIAKCQPVPPYETFTTAIAFLIMNLVGKY